MECLLHAKCCDGYWRKKWRTEGMWSLLLVYYWEQRRNIQCTYKWITSSCLFSGESGQTRIYFPFLLAVDSFICSMNISGALLYVSRFWATVVNRSSSPMEFLSGWPKSSQLKHLQKNLYAPFWLTQYFIYINVCCVNKMDN